MPKRVADKEGRRRDETTSHARPRSFSPAQDDPAPTLSGTYGATLRWTSIVRSVTRTLTKRRHQSSSIKLTLCIGAHYTTRLLHLAAHHRKTPDSAAEFRVFQTRRLKGNILLPQIDHMMFSGRKAADVFERYYSSLQSTYLYLPRKCAEGAMTHLSSSKDLICLILNTQCHIASNLVNEALVMMTYALHSEVCIS